MNNLNLIFGSKLSRCSELSADVVVVGSGPAGATVARTLARSGVRVIVVEINGAGQKG